MRIITLAFAAVLVVACGGSDDDEPSTGADIGPDDVAAENYDIAYTICTGILDGTIKDNSGVTADPETNPEAYAFEYAEESKLPEYRGPVRDGCLDALEGREKNPPG